MNPSFLVLTTLFLPTLARGQETSLRTVVGEVHFADGTPVRGGRGLLHREPVLDPNHGGYRAYAPARYTIRYGGDPFVIDEQGRFEIATQAPRLALEVFGDSFATAFSELIHTHESEANLVHIAVDPGHQLRGVVRDDAGDPVAGATVSVLPALRDRYPDHLYGIDLARLTSTSGEDGRFVVRGLGENYRGYNVEHPEFLTTWDHEHPRSTSAEIEIRMSPAAWLTGRFVMAGTGDPPPASLPDSLVLIGNVLRSFETAEDGSFRSNPLPPLGGTERMAFEAFAPLEFLWDGGTGEQDVGEVVLDPGDPVVVTVLDERGEAMADAEVVLGVGFGDGSYYRTADQSRTDADGRAQLTGLAESRQGGFRYELTATRPGYAPVRLEFDQDAPHVHELQFVERLASLQGRATDESGQPVPGASVRAYWPLGDSTRIDASDSVTTDGEGRFLLPDVQPPGPVSIDLDHPEFLYASHEIGTITNDGVHDVGGLELPSAVEILGTVVDEHGTPVADTAVTVRIRRGGFSTGYRAGPGTETDEDGVFRIRGLEPGKYDLTAKDLRGHSKRLEVDTGTNDATTVHVELHRWGTVSGRVVDEAGEPISGAEVCVSSRHGPASFGASGPEGRFSLQVAEITEKVQVSIEHGESLGFSEETFRADCPKDFTMTWGAGADIQLRMLGGRPAPAGAEVWITSPTSFSELSARVEGGRITVRGRPAGQYTLQLMTDDFAPTKPVPVTLALGQTTEVEVVFDGHLDPVVIQVVDEHGAPHVDARVRFRWTSNRISYFGSGDTDRAGAFSSYLPHAAELTMEIGTDSGGIELKDLPTKIVDGKITVVIPR